MYGIYIYIYIYKNIYVGNVGLPNLLDRYVSCERVYIFIKYSSSRTMRRREGFDNMSYSVRISKVLVIMYVLSSQIDTLYICIHTC